MTDSLDLDALEAVARAATPGPWKESGLDDEPTVNHEFDTEGYGPGCGPHVYPDKPQDAVHIAAFDPPTVLALIGRVREAEADHNESEKSLIDSVLELTARAEAAEADLNLARNLSDQSRQFYDWGSEQRDRAEKAEAAIREEIEYLEGFRPDHAEHLMLLVGKSLERLRAALGGDQP